MQHKLYTMHLPISVDYKQALRWPVVPLHSVQNVINSSATVGTLPLRFQSGWKPAKGQRCLILQQVIRPLTRCSSFLGRPFVSLLEALFVASMWHFVFARVFGSFPHLPAERPDGLIAGVPTRLQMSSPLSIHKLRRIAPQRPLFPVGQ